MPVGDPHVRPFRRKSSPMNISWRYFGLFLALALLIGLAIINQAFIFTYMIDPLTRILWLILRLFQMIDQGVYWALLVFVAFIFFLRIIPDPGKNAAQVKPPDLPQLEDRVAYWQDLLHSAQEDAEARLALLQNLKNLRGSIDALVETNDRAEIILPPLKAGLRKRRRLPASLERLWPKNGRPQESKLEQSINQILNSMETQMEMKNDRSASHPNDR